MTSTQTPAPAAAEPVQPPPGPGEGSIAYVAPFAVFMLLLVAAPYLPFGQPWESVLRVVLLIVALYVFSRRVIPRSAPHWLASVGVGVAVFVVWIAPDLLIPGYREHWLFQNGVTGEIKNSIPPAELRDPLVLALRFARAALLVPIIEELFWRGWLPRWMQNPRFERVPMGQYTALAFWATAILFASEHGPYWEVGLAAGIIYNLWMRRTRSLGDLVLAHAVTNACLSAYVLFTGKWEYWM